MASEGIDKAGAGPLYLSFRQLGTYTDDETG
jgi:hypothetical protein